MTTAYIGIGSNEGDRVLNLAQAIEALSEIPETHVERASHAYETEPAYVADQPPFANAVVEVETELEADQLLGYLQHIEDEMGRVRADEERPARHRPRHPALRRRGVVSEELTIPHPGLLERDFVVTPLLEIAPRLHLPDGTQVRTRARRSARGRRPWADPGPGQAHQRAGARRRTGFRRRELARAGPHRGLGRGAAVPARGARGGRHPVRVGPVRAGVDDGSVRHAATFKLLVPWATSHGRASCSRMSRLPSRSSRRISPAGSTSRAHGVRRSRAILTLPVGGTAWTSIARLRP